MACEHLFQNNVIMALPTRQRYPKKRFELQRRNGIHTDAFVTTIYFLEVIMKRMIIAAAISLSALVSAHAASITGLNNTGIGAGGANDTSYQLSIVSDTWNGSTVPVITLDNTWPVNTWLANDSTSKWITPTANQGQSYDAWNNGTYTYRLSFDLTGFDAATASFAGRVLSDNTVKVLLNNTEIASGNGFTTWSNFTAASGFTSGVNQLDFVVTNWAQNSGNPTGLRVEFGQSAVTAVPEPETYAMMLGGLGLVGFIARRRKNKQASA